MHYELCIAVEDRVSDAEFTSASGDWVVGEAHVRRSVWQNSGRALVRNLIRRL